ncbi:MAG TPA: thiosulfate oxidation carrier protein SoxY [Burkholderiales bacterium]|nr:thiosulfate oxidation carrier protein SoxY [Burkholderiales bacterium]
MKRRGFISIFALFPLAGEMRKAAAETTARRGKVKLELPVLADNGNSVPMKVSVESAMTEAEHVKAIRLVSERNPEREMAVFYFGPRSGAAEVTSRVRLAGSQTVTAIAEMSDGSQWMDSAHVQVTLSACVDGSG